MCPNFSKFLHFFGDRSSVILLHILSVDHKIDMDRLSWRSLKQSQVLMGSKPVGADDAAGFRHSAGLRARVILDGAACRLGEPGEVHDVLGVLGVHRVVVSVLRVLVSWWKEE